MGEAALGVERAVDRVNDDADARVAVVDLPALLGERDEAEAVRAQAIKLGEHDRLGGRIDDERAVAAAASRAGFLGSLRDARPGREHLGEPGHSTAAGGEPIGIEGGAGGRHLIPMLSDVSEEPSTPWSEAVSHAGGPQLILGCAGSGKTSLIEARFCRLVDDGERPERVLILASSAGRADAIRVRLEARLERGYEALHVLTPVGLAALGARDCRGR